MNIKRRIALFLLLVVSPLFCIWLFQQKYMQINGETMGTTYTVKCYVPKWVNKQNVKLSIEKELNRINQTFSTWDDTSEISQFNNQNTTKNIDISNDFRDLMDVSFQLHNHTTGYFDPTIKILSDIWGFSSYKSFFSIPNKQYLGHVSNQVGLSKIILEKNKLRKIDPDVTLDLSAIVKGFAVDQITLLLEEYKSKKYMVEIGGEVRVLTHNDNEPWKIGINKPKYHDVKQTLMGAIELTNAALATSGDYQNFFEKNGVIYSHVMDAKKSSPTQSRIASVSIIAPNCLLADGLATSVMAMGVNRGLSLIESYPNVEGLIIVRNHDNSLELFKSSRLNKTNFKLLASL